MTVQEKRDQLARKLRMLADMIEDGLIDQWQFSEKDSRDTHHHQPNVRLISLNYLRT